MTIRAATMVLMLLCCQPTAAAQLASAGAVLAVNDSVISISRNGELLVELTAVRFNYRAAVRWAVTEESDGRLVLKGTFPADADFYRAAGDDEARFAELTISAVNGGFRFRSNPSWARQTTLDFNYLGDHFFGLSELLQPGNRRSPNLAPGSITVDVNAEPASLQENFASAFSAFYISSLGYGAFFDTFARGQYDFAINGENRIHHETGDLDWYVFVGADGAEIHAAYYRVIGQPKALPAWGLGPIGWRDQNDGGAAEIIADIRRMTDLRIPFTAWFVDRPYSDGAHAWSEMNFNEQFSDPDRWIGQIRDSFGMEFMTWVSPATFGDTRFEQHLGGDMSYIDLSHAPSVHAYQQALNSEQYVHGVKGHKIDRGDENFPLYESWSDDSVPPAERRNRYAWLMAATHDEVLREAWGEDQVTFARAAIHRTQPFLSAIWAGDPRTSWEGLQSNFANAARSAFMGFPVWGTDVGGYQGEGYIPPDLYIRWLQAGSMSGLFEIKLDGAGGQGRDRMPWQYDDGVQERFREICENRMRLLPYLYSLSRTSGTTGPLMQPPAYRHLHDERTYDIWDQFYVGEAILVAPVLGPEGKRNVYLPEGNWRDFDDPGIRYPGGQTVTLDAPLAKLPRFVAENSLFVTGNIYLGNDRAWSNSDRRLTVHAYPGRKDTARNFLYVDMLDQNRPKNIRMTHTADGVQVTVPPMKHVVRLELVLDRPPVAVIRNGRSVDFEFNEAAGTLAVDGESEQEMNVSVQWDRDQ